MRPKVPDPAHEVRRFDFKQGRLRPARGPLALEMALEIVINGRSHSLLMQTPGAEPELLTGFLATEGLIDSAADIQQIDYTSAPGVMGVRGLRADVHLPALVGKESFPERPALSLASCGLCGKENLEQVARGLTRIKSRTTFLWSTLTGLLVDLRKHQPLYEQTRGVHAAALYSADGSFLACYEDVGRHNALDKVIGHALLAGWVMEDKLVLLSGRASLEMVLKAARAGLPVVLCFSSPSVLAVEAAKVLNLTLVGRQGDTYLTGYTHLRRLKE